MTDRKRFKIILIIICATLATVLCCVGIYVFRDVIFYKDPAESIILNGGISLHFVDVGQADCMLLMTPDGNMLIDSGTDDSEEWLSGYLDSYGIESITYFVLTHPHDDHIGGADMILKEYEVENIVMTEAEDDSEMYREIESLIDEKDINVIVPHSGDVFYLGELKSTVLAPIGETNEYGELNSTSIVLKCEFGECSFITTGDAEVDSEKEMIEEYGEFLDCDILKLGHHGSKTSSSYDFLKLTSPKYAIACCGKDNTYGHPSAEVTYRLDIFDIQLLRTDKEGSIIFVCDGEEFEYISDRL